MEMERGDGRLTSAPLTKLLSATTLPSSRLPPIGSSEVSTRLSMSSTSSTDMQRLVESVAARYPGPGGACALLKDGEVVGQHAWGYADLEKRLPMTADTILPICSISKQFVCLVLASILRQPGAREKADAALKDLLPAQKDVTIERLAHMQSGIRDYWALSVLWGAQLDGRFTLSSDAPASLQRLGNLHFDTGTQSSYSNVNFYVLGRVAEIVTDQPLAHLLVEHVFKPAGMSTAQLYPDTNDRPGPVVGYEGSEKHGYYRALNRIEWAGDAGIVATLTDMIAYEKYLDQQHADPSSLYRHNAGAVAFVDGSPASYGWGLIRDKTAGHVSIGHGGALRGFRLQRKHVPEARMSAVVMFNHEADAGAAATYILEKALAKPEDTSTEITATDGWIGTFFDEEAQHAIAVTAGSKTGELLVNCSFHPEKVKCTSPNEAQSSSMTASLSNDTLTLHRPQENRVITARRISPVADVDGAQLIGAYRSDEIDSTLHVTGSSGVLYGAFDGYLGQGPEHLMKPLGENIWYLRCERSLDAQAPGNWTVVFTRNEEGMVEGAMVGCLIARKVPYKRV